MTASRPHSSQWHRNIQRPALLEFSSIKSASPEGIYIALNPGDFSQWSGVFFKGPYASAILRFRVAFPPKYPVVAPSITFVSDIFHPLVTPLTTYTYTTGSLSSDTVSATDEERLPPGGFSLRHGFPSWFGRAQKSIVSSRASSGKFTSPDHATNPNFVSSVPVIEHQHTQNPTIQSSSSPKSSPSIIDVLNYMKRIFEDESSLDTLPLEVAGNSGAWNAWRSYREGVSGSSTYSDRKHSHHQEEWSWEGVWEDRVRKGIQSSASDAVLYGNIGGGDSLINFVDITDDYLRDIKASIAIT